ncbi:MAG: diguanylate cyclase [Sphingomonadales bacterium]|nr:diguanylate cyclase [Sphingomonadales bacterium]
MSKSSVTLDLLEAFTARRKRGLAFPAAIEEQFERDTQARRSQRVTTGILVSAVIYNFFLIADWLLVPDVLWRASAIHFGIVTPWMLGAAWIISRRPSAFAREALAASIPLVIILQIHYGFAITTSQYAAHYQYVVIPTLLYANVSFHRLAFPFALSITGIIVVCHAALVLVTGHMSGPTAIMVIVHLVVCAYITLIANYQMERDLRRAYLYSLRDRLRHAEADAASRRDALTGLANRRHLDAELAKLWAAQEHEVSPVSVVLIDIDFFKPLNDRYGHATGDVCLKRVAAIVMAELRGSGDHAVRFGGEEFLLLLPRMDMADAMRVAERIRRAVEAAAIPNEGSALHGVLTASFGVAAASTSDLSATELIAAADSALYAAKRKGRNQVWPPLATGDPAQGECISMPVVAVA